MGDNPAAKRAFTISEAKERSLTFVRDDMLVIEILSVISSVARNPSPFHASLESMETKDPAVHHR
jgi:hypothetical protein